MLLLMRFIRYAHEPLRSLLGLSLEILTVAARRALTRVLAVSGARRPQRKTIAAIALVFGLLMQLALVYMVSELVGLIISLMEVWAELAAKHLEITLDRTS